MLQRFAGREPPAADRAGLLRAAAHVGIAGGGVYALMSPRSHASPAVIVIDNRRRFVSALRLNLRVETPAEDLASLRPRR